MLENKEYTFSRIKKYFFEKDKILWLGGNPIIESECTILESISNFRSHSKNHGKYSVIISLENELFSTYSNAWKLVLDELIRHLNSSGTMIFRTRDNQFGTLYELKSILGRNTNLTVSLLEQFTQNKETISIFNVVRENYEKYSDKSWTIGILSNGAKNDNVVELVKKSIKLGNESNLDIEIIIAGPKISQLNETEKLKYIDIVSDDLARISYKKNEIVKNSSNENIMIVHDRYQISDNFFWGFEEYGYDFDFITVRQKYPSGNEFPSYLLFEENRKSWQVPIKVNNYDVVFDSSFINGGLIILKRHTAINHNFNNLLLHNEAEDVELSMVYTSMGMYPRINTISTAFTIGIDDSYTGTFLSYKDKKNIRSKKSNIHKLLLKIWFLSPKIIRNRMRGGLLYEKARDFYHHR